MIYMFVYLFQWQQHRTGASCTPGFSYSSRASKLCSPNRQRGCSRSPVRRWGGISRSGNWHRGKHSPALREEREQRGAMCPKAGGEAGRG